jgi:putative phage-type endonuclease
MRPGSAEWVTKITASKVAAIVGVSPDNWESRRSLWLKMRGDIPWDDGRNMAEKSRGHYLENGIIDWWADRHPELTVIERQVQVSDPRLPWAAATPDAMGSGDGVDPVFMDAKTSRNDAEWGQPGTDEVPDYYRVQVMWAMHLSGVRVAHIALLTQFLDLREYVIPYDPFVGADLEARCAEFLASLDDPAAIPAVDGSPATLRAEMRRHASIDPDDTVELDRALAADFVDIKAREAEIRAVQVRVREAMGTARLAVVGDVVVARRQSNGRGVSLMPVAKTLPPAQVAS